MTRKTIYLGDDRFAVDPDSKIYRNGYGLTPVGLYLFYYEDHKRKKILRDALIYNLFCGEMNEEEAVRRAKIATSHAVLSLSKRRGRTRDASIANIKKVYCVTQRRRFRSMTEAAEYYDVAVPTLSNAIKRNTKVKGLKFRFIP